MAASSHDDYSASVSGCILFVNTTSNAIFGRLVKMHESLLFALPAESIKPLFERLPVRIL
jgi:hypothetical protein